MRFLSLVVAAAALASAHGAPQCPRSLNAVLESTPCDRHLQRLLTTSYTVLEPLANDVCVDSLRALVASSPSLPCTTLVHPINNRRLQQVTYNTYVDDSFSGHLKCSFDFAHPVNLSNLNQTFEMHCEDLGNSNTWLWWTLGILGGLLFTYYLFCVVMWAYYKYQDWRNGSEDKEGQDGEKNGRRGRGGRGGKDGRGGKAGRGGRGNQSQEDAV